jgi:very-short-patch-repair endonuclease
LRIKPTGAERILWSQLKGNRQRNMHFRRQQVIAGFIADLYCYQARLVIEVDGAIHERQREYDLERERVIKSLGLRILRFTNNDIECYLLQVLHQICTALDKI